MNEYIENNYKYNRIVIVGNGYDRALGMQTSYKEFLLDYLKSCAKEAMKAPYHNDSLIKIDHINFVNNHELLPKLDSINDVKDLLQFIGELKKTEKSELLELLVDKLHKDRWVDIESLYFTCLIEKIQQIKKSSLLKRDFTPVEKLNAEFNSLSKGLNSYIQKIDSTFNIDFISHPLTTLNDIFFEKQIHTKAYLTHQRHELSIKDPNKVLFLNFNYTNSLNKTLHSFPNKNTYHVLHIHGQINNPKNPIIFGYGDDTHHYYREIEIEDSFQPLEFIKSFHYPKTANYHTLLDFMSEEKFEIYIVGHSCGLSDRTLLKTIFEDDNCLAIKIFHRGSEKDHFLKNISISKHFSDKQKLRKKILPYDEHATIPQSNW